MGTVIRIVAAVALFGHVWLQTDVSGANSTASNSTGCDSNCIVCSSSNQCLLCDFTRNFYLSNSNCVAKNFTGCTYRTVDGNCMMCQAGMVATPTNCQTVNENTPNIIKNCTVFGDNPNTCLRCALGYYLNNGACVASKSNITNCVMYSADGIYCIDCAYGYYPGPEFASCVSANSTGMTGCIKYGFLNCLSCAPFYNIDENLNYFQIALQSGGLTNQNAVFLQSLAIKDTYNDYYNKCSNYQLQNCAVAASLTQCVTCNSGYILNANQACIPVPKSSVGNCAVYLTASTCALCLQNFWLQSPTSCQPVITIQYCVQYHPMHQSTCVLCDTIYYLQNNLCYSRSMSLNINNCLQTFVDRDMCQTCNSGYVLNFDYTKCLPNIFNCNSTFFSGNNIVCVSCQSGYYLSNGACNQGSIANCVSYQNSTACLSCSQGYYLLANLTGCVLHSLAAMIPCQQFSTTALNYCLVCNPTRVGFSLLNICLPVSSLSANCVAYAPSGACSLCNSTVSYLANNGCLLGTVAGCVQYHPTQNQCLNCTVDSTTGLALIPSAATANNKCVAGNQNEYNNCQTIGTAAHKPCLACAQGNFQYLFTSPTIRWCVSNSSSIFPSSPKTNLCNLYDYVNNLCLQCLQSGSGEYYVLLNGQCIKSCPAGMSPQVFDVSNNQIQRMFVCQPNNYFTPTTFVMQYNIPCIAFVIDVTGKWSCASCATGFVGVFDTAVSANNAIKYSYLLTTSFGVYYNSLNSITVSVGCLSAATGQSTGASTTYATPTNSSSNKATVDLSNCRNVRLMPGTNLYGCVQCQIGFSGTVGQGIGTSDWALDNCGPITGCQSDVWINGLVWGPGVNFPYPLDFYASCHLCGKINGAATIPTFGMALTTITTSTISVQANYFANFGIPGVLDITVMPYQVMQVNNVYQTTCQVPGITQPSGFPANCGAQMIALDRVMSPYTNPTGVSIANPICVVCAPTFSPVYDGTMPYLVTGCQPITNCLYSNTFNVCELCASGYALLSTNLFKACVATQVQGCYVATAAGACTMCTQGQILDPDGNCSSINPLSCSQSNQGFYTPALSLNDMYNFFMKGVGCLQCDPGNVAIFSSNVLPVCVTSQVIVSFNNGVNSRTKIYIPFCMYYGLDSNYKIICRVCNTNYIPQQDQTACYLPINATLKNCAVTQNSGAACLRCVEGYYYDAVQGGCQQGMISNCLTYLTQQTCARCAPGYFVSTTISGATLCFDGSLLNCQDIDQAQSVGGNIYCRTCAAGFYLTSDVSYGNFPLKQCMPVPPSPNCVAYSTQSTITNSRLTCLQCTDGYFLNKTTNLCVQRKAVIANCSSVSPTADRCQACADGFFLAADYLSCVPNPTGINNCIAYLNPSTCSQCLGGMYLWKNSCLMVASQNIVSSCLYYKSYFECSQCQPNFYLTQNTCKIANAANCLTFQNASACATCSPGYGLSVTLNIQSCVQLQAPNCDTPDPNSIGPNFSCLVCSPGYYQSSGACIQVVNPITNCKYYKNATTCLTCYSSMVVSYDGTSCVNNAYLRNLVDPNCASSYLKISCQLCAYGYYLQNGACVACPTNSTACMQCSPYTPTRCLVCNTGFSQVANGTCIPNGAPIPTQSPKGNTNQTQNSSQNKTNLTQTSTALKSLALIFTALIIVCNLGL